MVSLLVAGVLCVGGLAEEIDPARVAEIAAMLPARAEALGPSIDDRAAWAAIAAKPAYAGVVAAAEGVAARPLPEQPEELFLEFSRNGNRTNWQNVAGERRNRIAPLTLGECLEDQGRFVGPLCEVLAALCAEPTWVMPAHDGSLKNLRGEATDIDLGSSTLAWEIALSARLLGERLPAESRALVADNLRRRILEPFARMVRGEIAENWWMRGRNNWNAVCLAGVMGAALAACESPEERAWYVAAVEKYVGYSLEGFTADGYCSEGVGYWDYGFGRYILLSDAVRRATRGGVDFLALPAALEPALYGTRIEIVGGVCPAFADCSVTGRPDGSMLWYLNRRFGLGLTGLPTDVTTSGGGLAHCLTYTCTDLPEAPAAAQVEGRGLRTWFDIAGVLICRPAEGSPCRMGVAMKGGHNAENHNHNDIGSYVVVLGARPVLLDPGSETYTARTFSARRYESKLLNSYGHPVPVVAGKLQLPGRGCAAKVLATSFTETEDTLTLDLSAGYSCAELTKLVRTFTYSREGAGSLTVTDEAEFSTPQAFGTAILTLGEWQQVEPDVLEVTDGGERLRVEIVAEGGTVQLGAEVIEENAPVKPTRIGIDFTEPVTSCRVTLRITPLGSGGA